MQMSLEHVGGNIERLRRVIEQREERRNRDLHRLRTLTARRKMAPRKLQRVVADHDRVLMAQQMELYNLLLKAEAILKRQAPDGSAR